MITCPPTKDVGNASTLWTTTVADTTEYRCHSFAWKASNNGSVSFVIRLRNDPHSWCIDDVSILGGGIEMLANGGFETGSFSPWIWSRPNGACGSYPSMVTNSAGVARSGSYGLWDGSFGCFDQLSQSFHVAKGQTYEIHFWLKSTSNASSGILADFSIV